MAPASASAFVFALAAVFIKCDLRHGEYKACYMMYRMTKQTIQFVVSSTYRAKGAALLTGKLTDLSTTVPAMKGKLTGKAFRVPTIGVSVEVCELEKLPILFDEARVSTDFEACTISSTFVKLVAWYDKFVLLYSKRVFVHWSGFCLAELRRGSGMPSDQALSHHGCLRQAFHLEGHVLTRGASSFLCRPTRVSLLSCWRSCDRRCCEAEVFRRGCRGPLRMGPAPCIDLEEGEFSEAGEGLVGLEKDYEAVGIVEGASERRRRATAASSECSAWCSQHF